jgi:hypothetical protein
VNHLPAHPTAPGPAVLAVLLDRAERDIAAQRRSYGTEQNEDTAWRCAWNTWRTLQELLPAVRALLDQPPTPAAPAAVRHLTAVPARAA